MNAKVIVLNCIHETKHGIDPYVSIHNTVQEALNYVGEVQSICDYDPDNYGEYFDYHITEHIVDINLLHSVHSDSTKEV